MADKHISRESLSWALDHIVEFGDIDLFPPLFEFDLVKKHWEKFQALLTLTDVATASRVRTETGLECQNRTTEETWR